MSNYVISISREFGSGGRLIGKQLAQQLGIPCYDRTIIQKAAEKSGLSPDFIARAGERLRGRFRLPVPAGGGNPAFSDQSVPASQQAFFAQSEVILELADQGPCVIVGRCAGWVLREQPHVLNVFIHADRQERLRRAVEEYGIPQDQAASVLHRFDHRRSNFYHANTGRSWREREGYHMVLDSGLLGVELCSQLLVAAAQSEG